MSDLLHDAHGSEVLAFSEYRDQFETCYQERLKGDISRRHARLLAMADVMRQWDYEASKEHLDGEGRRTPGLAPSEHHAREASVAARYDMILVMGQLDMLDAIVRSTQRKVNTCVILSALSLVMLAILLIR